MDNTVRFASWVVGAITGLVAGTVKLIISAGINPVWFPGILLPDSACLLMPVIGGIPGWIGEIVVKRISKAETAQGMASTGGFWGGVVAALIFIPVPYLPL